jgi:tRNA threonylcarbamoyladenosine biosynthesis protein TsaB
VKGLALALNKPIIEVPTIDAMAYNYFGSSKWICPIMDARRNQVYTGLYTFRENEMIVKKTQSAMAIEELVQELNQLEGEIVFVGDGIPRFSEYIDKNIQISYSYAPAHLNRQRAGALGALGMKLYREGKYVSAGEHVPDYIRPSQAERCLNENSSNE